MTDTHTPDKDADSESAYTEVIGERVRATRARRGMARKQLSAESNISERYLAQLEGGKANISIVLLHRLAKAMVVPLTDLLPGSDTRALPAELDALLGRLEPEQLNKAYRLLADHFEPRRRRLCGVALIGLRGGGKTTLGERIASELQVPFLRISEVVEDIAGMSLSEIMALGGQSSYRRMELEALDKTLEQHHFSIIEAGGSLVSEPETYQRLLQHFFTVWIQASPEEHMQRVIAQGDTRPIQGNRRAMDDLRRILIEREADYRKADYILSTSHRSIDNCFDELVSVALPYYQKYQNVN